MKPNVDYISDLHIEINSNSEQCIQFYESKSDNDVLILLGDITCYRFFDPKRTDPESRSIRKRFVKFLQTKCEHYRTILYIPGNHEYYGHHWEGADQLFQDRIRTIDSRIVVMQNDTYQDDNITIFGSTFWTDFDRGNPLVILQVENGLNDYRLIRAKADDPQLLCGYMIQEAHAKSLAALKKSYQQRDPTKKFIVATHHGPSFRSHSFQRFGDTSIKYGFLSNYDQMIMDMDIDCWLHGHTHHNIQYMVGRTNVTSCMYGYLGSDRVLADRKQLIGRI